MSELTEPTFAIYTADQPPMIRITHYSRQSPPLPYRVWLLDKTGDLVLHKGDYVAPTEAVAISLALEEVKAPVPGMQAAVRLLDGQSIQLITRHSTERW